LAAAATFRATLTNAGAMAPAMIAGPHSRIDRPSLRRLGISPVGSMESARGCQGDGRGEAGGKGSECGRQVGVVPRREPRGGNRAGASWLAAEGIAAANGQKQPFSES